VSLVFPDVMQDADAGADACALTVPISGKSGIGWQRTSN
jgi:hypothetical protein